MILRSIAFLLTAGSLYAIGPRFTSVDSAAARADDFAARSLADRVTLTVIVSGVTTAGGNLGTAVFTSPAGFPDAPVPLSLVHPHTTAPVDTFVFRDLVPGRYAMAVQHDLNGNGVVDRNVVGLPKEPWGVSRGIRHKLRAPRFEEAAFNLRSDTIVTVRVAR